MKRRRGGQHRLKGRPARGLEWVVEQRGGKGRGRHRLPAPSLPAAGAIAAGVVLLATSSAASPAAPLDGPRAADKDRAKAEDQFVPRGMDNTRVGSLPSVYQAAGTVENVDDAGAIIPAVFTGDIPATVLDAYQRARDMINKSQPGCHLPLELLEAIGKVETGHARNGMVDSAGTTLRPILGPVLDGNGFAAISDTDGGRFDSDPVWDRAVGPMQFIPGTWKGWFADGNEDLRADPHNVYDASLAAARYLCAANRDLGTPEGLNEAIFSYNRSISYRNLVLAWMSTYASGTTAVPNATALDLRAPGAVPVLAASPARPGQETPAAVPPAPPATPEVPPTTEPPPVVVPPTEPPVTPPPTTPPPAQPPTTPPPTTPPPSTPPPTTEPPTTPPTTPPPTTEPNPAPSAGPVSGLVCAVTGLVSGLLGGQTGGC